MTSSAPFTEDLTFYGPHGVQKQGWANRTDWEEHHATIKLLYKHNTLPKVMQIMKTQYGFKATLKMYKSHIKKWGLDKKNKEFEMKAVVRKNRDRVAKGQASTFSIRGKAVDMKAVTRYWERKRLTLDEVAAQRAESKTPEQIQCITPVPSPIRTPEILAIPESVLLKLRDFHQGLFGHGISRSGQQRSLDARSNQGSNPSFPISGLSDQCDIACELFACNSFEDGRQALEAGFDEIKEVVEAGHPNIFPSLFWLATRLDLLGRHEIGLMIFRHFSAMGQILLGPNHPVKLVCGWLASLENSGQSSFEDAIRRGNQVVCDVLERVVEPFNTWTTEARFRSLWLANTNVLDFEGLVLSKLQRDCVTIRCEKSLETLCIRLFLAHFESIKKSFAHIKKRNPTEKDYIQRIHKSIYVERSFEALVWSLHKLTETKASLKDIEMAIDWCVSERGSDGSPVHAWLLVLERWLIAEGQRESAGEVRAKRAMLKPSLDAF